MIHISRTTRSQIAFFLFALAVILVVVACAPTPEPTKAPPPPSAATAAPATKPTDAPAATAAPAAGATNFRVAIGVDPDTLDPMGQPTTTIQNIVDYMAEGLVTMDSDGKLQPLLAKSWTISSDGLAYTFKLQDGVKFSDGAVLDAAAVKASLDRILDPDNTVPLRGVLAGIQKVDVVDPSTVKLTLKTPSTIILPALTLTTAAILSPATIDKAGPGYKKLNNPVGSGPYIFKEYAKGSQVVVTKNPNYWGKKPYYDTVTFRIVPEAATRESLILAGQVDMMILPPVSDIPALQKNAAVKVLLATGDRTIYIVLNTTSKPLDNPKVRQALNYAVNKEDIVKNILFGTADVMDGPAATTLFGYCKTGPYPYDPVKAKQLLSEAGVAPGTKLGFISPTGRYVQDFQASQAISGYLKEVGIDAPVTTMDWPSYIATITKAQAENTTQLHLLGWAPGFMDFSQQVQQFMSDQQPPKGLATAFYKNTKMEDLIAQAIPQTDDKKRADLYCQASKLIWDDAPWIYLWTQRFPIVYSAKVKGISSIPNEKFFALYAEPAQ